MHTNLKFYWTVVWITSIMNMTAVYSLPTLVIHGVQTTECIHRRIDVQDKCVCESGWTGQKCDVEMVFEDNSDEFTLQFEKIKKPKLEQDSSKQFDSFGDHQDGNRGLKFDSVFDGNSDEIEISDITKKKIGTSIRHKMVYASVESSGSKHLERELDYSADGNEFFENSATDQHFQWASVNETSVVLHNTLSTNVTTFHYLTSPMVPLENRENSGLGLPYEEYSGSGSVNWVPEIYDEGGLLECNNGSVRKIFKYCSCEPNFTGEYCETELFQNTHQEASTLTLDYSGSGSGAGICFHGIPVFIKRCECHFGYTGISCERKMTYGSGEENNVLTEEPRNKSVVNRLNSTEDIAWSASAFDELTWNPITRHLNPNRNLAASRHIFEEKFIVISTGIRRTKTKLDYFNPVNPREPTIYRFSFVPKPSGGKSRLELNTCFVEKRNSQRIFGTQEIDDLIRSTLITQCPIANMPITALHTYTYELYIPRADFNDEGKYLLTQWHGSPNPNILKDEYGCVAELSLYDKGRLCRTGSCTQGEIFDRDGQHIGLLYQQGGYPPLAFEYIKGVFVVTARSDEHSLSGKAGCSVGQNVPPHFHCPKHDRQQFSEIFRMAVNDFPFDSWARFEWKVKWSEYDTVYKRNKTMVDGDPGIMTSQAWIRLWINGRKVIDWIGACGRNDEGRIPYFKIGIYNPSGNRYPLRMYVRGYHHTFRAAEDLLSDNEKDIVRKLKLYEHVQSKELSRNSLIRGMKFTHIGGDGYCTLRANLNHVSHITRTKFSRLKVDSKTRNLLKSMVYAIEQQDFRIKYLERLVHENCNQNPVLNEEPELDDYDDDDDIDAY